MPLLCFCLLKVLEVHIREFNYLQYHFFRKYWVYWILDFWEKWLKYNMVDWCCKNTTFIYNLFTFKWIEYLIIIIKNIHYGTQQYTPAQIIPLAPWLRAFHLAHLLRWAMSDSLHLAFGAMEPPWCITYWENIQKIFQRCWGQKYYH